MSPVSQEQIPFLLLSIFTNSFFPSGYPDKLSHQNANLSRCNPWVQTFPGVGQQAFIVEQSVCKSSLRLHNRLPTEISISLHHPILKTLIKKTEKPSSGEEREDWMINVMGMTFLMRRHFWQPLPLPVLCMSTNTVGMGFITYTAFTNT